MHEKTDGTRCPASTEQHTIVLGCIDSVPHNQSCLLSEMGYLTGGGRRHGVCVPVPWQHMLSNIVLDACKRSEVTWMNACG